MTQTEVPHPDGGVPRSTGDTGAADVTLTRALGDYVRGVAEAVGVPEDGVTWEVTDTVTAYLALPGRSPDHPGRDTMLVWNEQQGWVISVETGPAEHPIVLSRTGADLVPAPEVVARLVAESIGGTAAPQTPQPARDDRTDDDRTDDTDEDDVDRVDLAERMNRHNRSQGSR